MKKIFSDEKKKAGGSYLGLKKRGVEKKSKKMAAKDPRALKKRTKTNLLGAERSQGQKKGPKRAPWENLKIKKSQIARKKEGKKEINGM